MARGTLTSVGLLLAGAAGCSRGESRPVDADAAGRAARGALARGEVVAVARDVVPPNIRPTQPAYRVAAVAGAGSVTGAVTLDGPAPIDSAVTPHPADRRACGTRLIADRTLEVRGGGVAGAVVWLEGVGVGKPFAVTRRQELTLERCRLAPRALAAAAGGTLNVHGVDPLDSRLRFARAAGAADAGRVLLRTAMTDAGQVVPDERVLAAPGAVEVRGEGRHPWLRAWVLVFDQPYFAVTGGGGAFTLGDVPPGTYQLVTWHERLGRVTQPVTVAAGQVVTVGVTLRAPGAEPAVTAVTATAR